MKNPMGVEMSPRAERIYGWLQRRGIQITQWSTDQCVQTNYGKLQDALTALEKAQSEKTEKFLDELTLTQVKDMEIDLRNIMRRTPDRRVV